MDNSKSKTTSKITGLTTADANAGNSTEVNINKKNTGKDMSRSDFTDLKKSNSDAGAGDENNFNNNISEEVMSNVNEQNRLDDKYTELSGGQNSNGADSDGQNGDGVMADEVRDCEEILKILEKQVERMGYFAAYLPITAEPEYRASRAILFLNIPLDIRDGLRNNPNVRDRLYLIQKVLNHIFNSPNSIGNNFYNVFELDSIDYDTIVQDFNINI